jgi:hypothetical protein
MTVIRTLRKSKDKFFKQNFFSEALLPHLSNQPVQIGMVKCRLEIKKYE